jgi:hypothetical protein
MTARISSLAKTDRGDDVFVVNVFRSHGIRHKVYRNYRDFYSLQLSLISRFPREAGKVPGFARTLPFMPAPVPKVTEEVRRMRRVDIDDYLQRLFRMSANIKQCQLVVDFMRPEAGDESVDGLILETPIPYENDNSVALANGHTGIIPSFLPSNIMDPVKISSFLVANKQQQSSQQQLRKHFRNRPSAATNNNSSPLKIVIPANPEISTELKSAPATAESPSKNEKCWDLDSEATKRPLSATETPASDLFDANLTKDLAKRRSSIDIKSVYVSLNISRGPSVNHQSQHKRLRVQRRVSFTNLCRKLQLKYGEFQQVSAVLNSKNTVCINNDQGLNRILNDSRLQTIVMMIY